MKEVFTYQKLVRLIESSAHELTQSYLQDIKKKTSMPTYQNWNEAEVCQRAYIVYSQLGKWISRDTSREEMQAFWTDLGRQRHREGFALSEIIQAIHLVRKQLWRKIQSEGLLDNALDLLMAFDLYNHVIGFFDRAVYYAVKGYESQD